MTLTSLKILFITVFFGILQINITYSQTQINSELKNYLNFRYLESDTLIGKYINGNIDSLGFKVYSGNKLPNTLPSQNRMITLRSNFVLTKNPKDEELVLVIPPIFYACNIYLNGVLFAKRGDVKYGYSSRQHTTEFYFLSPALLKADKPNEIAIELITKFGENSSVNGIFISHRKSATTYTFWRNTFSISFIKGMTLASVMFFLYFVVFYFFRKRQRLSYYIPFALTCLLYSLCYLNNVFNYDYSNNLLIEKITRTSFYLVGFFNCFTILEYSKVFKFKNKFLIFLACIYLIIIPLNLFQENVIKVVEFYSNIGAIFSLFLGLFNLTACIIFFKRTKSIKSVLILIGTILTIVTVIYDTYYFVVLQQKPYVVLLPYAMFLYTVLFFFILAWEQSEIYVLAQQKSEELEQINKNLETIVKERTEKALENELQFQSIFENTANAVFLLDKNANYITVNKAYTKTSGYDLDYFKNQKAGFLTHPDDKPRIDKSLRKLLTLEMKEYNDEFRILTKSGNYIWIKLLAVNFFNTKNEFQYILCSYIDISQQIKYREKIELSNSRLQDLLQLSHSKISDIQEFYKYALNTAVKITKSVYGYIYNYSEAERRFVLNSWSTDVMPQCQILEPRTVYELDKTGIWGEAVRQRKPIMVNNFADENSFKKGYPEGHVQLKRFLTIPFFVDEKIVAVVGVGNKQDEYDEEDIIQLKLLMETVWIIYKQKNDEIKIRELADKLQIANSTKDKFFGIIAHDLRSPFNAILGFSDILLNGISKYEKEQIKEYVSIISKSGHSAYNLLENLLEWSSSQTGGIVFQPSEIILEELFIDVIDLLKNQAINKQISVDYYIENPMIIFADKNMLFTILRNLISNAIKFTNKQGQITLKAIQKSNNIEITVSDNGVGMSEKHKNKLFKITEKVTTSGTDAETGTGLGLLLCKEFVDKHSGQIWVESEIDKGSDFIFTIPSLNDKHTIITN